MVERHTFTSRVRSAAGTPATHQMAVFVARSVCVGIMGARLLTERYPADRVTSPWHSALRGCISLLVSTCEGARAFHTIGEQTVRPHLRTIVSALRLWPDTRRAVHGAAAA